MGGGGSTEHHYHTQTVYQTPPAVQKELDDTKAKLEVIEKEAIEQGDPLLYADNSNKLFNNFVEKIPTLDLTDAIIKETGEEHIGVFGAISCGKTTLINTLFDLDLPTAMTHCTKKCEPVHKVDHQVFWDVPGSNDDYRFYKAQNLAFVKNLDKCIILFDNDIAMITNIIKVAYALNPDNIILVRTKVDQHSVDNVRTIEEERDVDKKTLNELVNLDFPIYYISCHNVVNGKPKFDWEIFRTVIGL